jgi:hypothetical protein
MKVCFQIFQRGFIESLESQYSRAAEFASQVGPNRLINISTYSPGGGAVTVWYWGDEDKSASSEADG